MYLSHCLRVQLAMIQRVTIKTSRTVLCIPLTLPEGPAGNDPEGDHKDE